MKKLLVLAFAICLGFMTSAQVKIDKEIEDGAVKVVVVSKDAADKLSSEFKSKKFKKQFKGYKKQFKGYRKNFKKSIVKRRGKFKKIGRKTSRKIRVAMRN